MIRKLDSQNLGMCSGFSSLEIEKKEYLKDQISAPLRQLYFPMRLGRAQLRGDVVRPACSFSPSRRSCSRLQLVGRRMGKMKCHRNVRVICRMYNDQPH
jgi:hypothetical protein